MGCEKEKIEKPPTWFAVHLSDGMTQYFEVEETKYIAFKLPQIRTYYLKMVFWEDKFHEEKQTFRVEYYAASSLTTPWKLDSMSLVAQTPASFAVLEKNQWHTKLQFPVFLSQYWPIHAGILGQNSPFAQVTQLFFEKKWKGKAVSLGTEITFQADSSLIHLRKHVEWYAPTVGLLEKYQVNLQYCEDSPDCIGLGIITSGYKRIISRIRLTDTLD